MTDNDSIDQLFKKVKSFLYSEAAHYIVDAAYFQTFGSWPAEATQADDLKCCVDLAQRLVSNRLMGGFTNVDDMFTLIKQDVYDLHASCTKTRP
jgi:hypothetical protein